MQQVLIVEDDPTILAVVQQVLDDDGYATVGVANGQAALDALSETRPDCIVLDLHMPILDGEGFLRALADWDERPPVLIMTSDPRGRHFGPADGVFGHIPKPFDLDDLSAAVGMAVYAS